MLSINFKGCSVDQWRIWPKLQVLSSLASEWRAIDPYRKYSESQVIYRNLPFDFNSITVHSPYKFSKNGKAVWTPLDIDQGVGTKAALSFFDCIGVSAIYGCNPNFCPDGRSLQVAVLAARSEPARADLETTRLDLGVNKKSFQRAAASVFAIMFFCNPQQVKEPCFCGLRVF